MVEPSLTSRGAARPIPSPTSTSPSRRSRSKDRSFIKHLQTLLGPRVATLRNLLLVIITIQSFVIVILVIALSSSYFSLSAPSSFRRSSHSSNGYGYQSPVDDQYGRPPPENNDPVQAAIDEANYDDMSPAITGIVEARKYTTLFGKFTRCKPRPCNIDHWPYLGDKCFYRDDHVKDRVGHNSSIWKLVEDDWYYTEENDFPCPVKVCRHQWNEELNMTQQIILRALQEHYSDTNSTVWNVEDMYTGSKYMRVNHFWGLEYKLHGGFTLTKVGENDQEVSQNKTATITVRRGFTQKYCDVSVNTEVQSPETPIYIVVPYTGRVEQLRLFYENVKQLVDEGVNLRVIVATHGGPVHILGASELLRDMQLGITEGQLTDGHFVQVIEAGSDQNGKFSRSKALMDGAMYVPADGLMFYCDVDMIIKRRFFDNCRHNAQRNYQVYYPVVFSLYPYGYKISKEHGYWRKGAFGMVCGYKSDFKRTSAWEKGQGKLNGWGFEDVLLHKEFSNHWQISVVHAIEPNLLHRWHPKYCEYNLHIAACLGTVFQNMGSQQFLASVVATNGIDVRQVKYDPPPVTFQSYKTDNHGDKEKFLDMPPAESETDDRKLDVYRKVYEEAISSGKGGLLSVFAKEAQDIMAAANTQQVSQAQAQNAMLHPTNVHSGTNNVATNDVAPQAPSEMSLNHTEPQNPRPPLHPDSPPLAPEAPKADSEVGT